MGKYKNVNTKVDFSTLEKAILEFWKKNDTFKQSIKQNENNPTYIMYDGPPFATGLPHYGHLIQSALKDTIPRYKTMKGYHVPRRFGWDCHGLPVENEAEKALGISGKSAIEEYGIANFNETCRKLVMRYSSEWQAYINRLGRWVDFENDYKTMDIDFMQSIWQVFKQLWDNNLIMQGHYILPFCSRCSTVLSNHELNMGGYKNVTDQSASVIFKRLDTPNSYFVAWTTTPWTLPSNLGLAVGPEIDYITIKHKTDNKLYTLGQSRLASYFASEKETDEYEIVWQGKGRDLAELEYEPIFDYFASMKNEGAFKVVAADYVSDSDGTGIVHLANGFGEDDYNALKDRNLTVVCPVDDEGKFTSAVSDYAGRWVKDCDKDILARLKDEGKLLRKDNYVHSYPHCWRCETPLIYKATPSWFVNVPLIRDKMLKANSQINWSPEHIKDGRFGKWLANARPWAISRNRFWGNPIPVWQCASCQGYKVIGSKAELESESGKTFTDLHMHFIDDTIIKCSCGGNMQRIKEVFDCWFESGSMPYAQNNYMFDKASESEFLAKEFPADFIAEGIDQTRGWFYTLTILAAALFDKPAFKNVMTTGLVLASDGQKMSKSKKNYSDPLEVVELYGADAVRLYLQGSALSKGEDLKFQNEGVKEVLKNTIIPLWNAYSFYVLYANIDEIDHEKFISMKDKPTNELDLWLISVANKLVKKCETDYESGDLSAVINNITSFIDELNNWYIRLNRRRFWKSDDFADKLQAYRSLHYALMSVLQVSAPVMPFMSEEIYQNLKFTNLPSSIHLCKWVSADDSLIDENLESKMSLVMRAVNLALSLRNTYNFKLRQPLKKGYIISASAKELEHLKKAKDLIMQELNLKELEFTTNEGDFVSYSTKANFKVLGKILGANMKEGASLIEKLSSTDIAKILQKQEVVITVAGEKIVLNDEMLAITRIQKEGLKVESEGSITIALDTVLTSDLIDEGLVRDFVRAVQNLRKESGFDVVDRINIVFSADDNLNKVILANKDFIASETLALSVENGNTKENKVECGDTELYISLKKA